MRGSLRASRFTFQLAAAILGIAFALLLLEVALRLLALRDPVPGAALARAAALEPPVFQGDCGAGRPQATLGHLVKPSAVVDLVYELKPGVETCAAHAHHITNSEGQRSRSSKPYLRSKPTDTFRVLLLGDSITYGQGVDYDATYGALLERDLSARARRRVEVINAGAPGYNTAQEAAYLAARGMRYEPDCIVVFFAGNDMGLPYLMLEPRDPLARHSFVLESVRRLAGWGDRGDPNLPPGMSVADGPWGTFVDPRDVARIPERYRHMVGLEGYRLALAAIAKTAGRIPVINIADYGAIPIARPELERINRELGVHHTWIVYPPHSDEWVAPDDMHPNAAGHRRLARELLAYLDQKKLCSP